MCFKPRFDVVEVAGPDGRAHPAGHLAAGLWHALLLPGELGALPRVRAHPLP